MEIGLGTWRFGEGFFSGVSFETGPLSNVKGTKNDLLKVDTLIPIATKVKYE